VDDDLSDAFKPIAGGSLNQFSGNADGVKNETATLLDFRQNWWGDASGPSDWSIGTGDSVSSDVQFFPWITVLADDFHPDQFAVCTISGNNSPNVLNGTAGSDIICGKGGNDSINGQGGNDLVIGDGGDDLLKGGPGDDAVLGTSGNDDIRANAGVDSVQGGPGTDTCTDPDPGQKATCELP
jgi:Ca2+-binding RTX toxin-like protein